MELSQQGGWCEIRPDWISHLLEMSDEELAAYAETRRGGGPCRGCGGTGLEHQPCGCPYCEGERGKACWQCDGTAIEPDHSSWYTREAIERLRGAGAAEGITFELPVLTVKRGGIQFPLEE